MTDPKHTIRRRGNISLVLSYAVTAMLVLLAMSTLIQAIGLHCTAMNPVANAVIVVCSVGGA